MKVIDFSRSWSTTQWKPRSFMASLSWMWNEEKRPFFCKIILMQSNAKLIAIINTLKRRV